LVGVSLSQREWDRAHGQKQKDVKGASNKMRFDGGIDLFFQFLVTLVIFEIEEPIWVRLGGQCGGPYMQAVSFSKRRESDPFMRLLVVSRLD
jgi:hypothetical protein